jgi:hypothetical protein
MNVNNPYLTQEVESIKIMNPRRVLLVDEKFTNKYYSTYIG